MNKDRSGHNVRVNTAVHPSRDRSNLSNSENSSLEPRRNGFKSVPPPIRAGSSELQRESAKSQSPAGGLEPDFGRIQSQNRRSNESSASRRQRISAPQ